MPFDADVAWEVCERSARGEPLTKICKDERIPSYETIYKWLREEPEFAEDYARAREDSAESGYFEIMDIERDLIDGKIDAGTARVAIDSIKWRIGKMKPKVYGDRLTLAGDEDAPLHHQVTAQVAALSVERRALIERIIGSSSSACELDDSAVQSLPKPE